MMEAILRDLHQPEYLHVLLNPLPVYGLAIALLGLIAATYLGTRGGQVTALVLIFACAAAAWPVAHYGEAAETNVVAMADEDGQAWLKAHANYLRHVVRVERFESDLKRRIARNSRFEKSQGLLRALDFPLPAVNRINRRNNVGARGQVFRHQLSGNAPGRFHVRKRAPNQKEVLAHSLGGL